MKSILFLIAILAAMPAQASFMQENCSNSDGTVKLEAGHRGNSISLAKYNLETAQQEELKYEFPENDKLAVEIKDSKELYAENKTYCNEGSSGGWFSSKTVKYQKVSITNKDGSAFNERTVGLSEDFKSVGADLICEFYVSGRTFCKP